VSDSPKTADAQMRLVTNLSCRVRVPHPSVAKSSHGLRLARNRKAVRSFGSAAARFQIRCVFKDYST
ncbi:MAG: hypothetical protein WBW35_03655, partial [Xanthobacteraceae bacterium]